MKSSKKDFIAEAGELLEEAGGFLVEIQETHPTGVNPDTVNALFRAVHTIKGISGLFGFADIADFSHVFESLLDSVRLGKVELSDEVVRILFAGIDGLKRAVEDIGSDRAYGISDCFKELEAFLDAEKGKQESQKPADPLDGIDQTVLRALSQYEEHRLKANVKEGKGVYLAKAVMSITDFDKELGELSKLIRSQGELLATLPVSADLPPEEIGFNLLFGSLKSPEELTQALNVEIVQCREAGPAPGSGTPQDTPGGAEALRIQEASLKSSTTSVRVDIEKLDRILNTISELSLAKAATSRIGREMAETYGHSDLVVDILKISQTLGKRIVELQEQVLEIRMVPIGQIFSRLNQVVRRYCRETGKQIDLVLYGEDTEIDKYLAEEIVDPLMHTVRNAMDHGIEPAEERRRAGKKETGTITLKAFQRGHHVVIEVRDDGAGIDIGAIEKKAREKGLIGEGPAPEEREVLDFMFLPGFSTKTSVSETSGRGVGMDVVRSKLSSFGGFVDLFTERGKGTTFMLTMPITLAILKSLLVRVGPERFAVPLTALSETLVLDHKDLQTIEGREVYNLRGEALPIVSLAKIFDLEGDTSDRSFIVAIRYGERSFGLLVDELIGQHEIVIKSLGDYFKGLRGFAGAAEIGKHEVILVLDIESIVEESVLKLKAASHV